MGICEGKIQQRTAVIYARFSSHNQREESIEQQVEECQAFARQNGLIVVETYADKAITGRRETRAAYQRMLRDAEASRFEVIIAYKSSRIARNMLNSLQLEDRLGEYGVRILYVKEEFGDNAAGRFALRSMMNVNQFYSENMAEDIMRGMSDNARSCKANGGTRLYGYRTGADGCFEVDPEEALVVVEIFEAIAAGTPFVTIINKLNGRGLRTSTGTLWNKNSFANMLKNERYIGVYTWAGERIPGGAPAIVDEELFNTAQARLTDKGRTRAKETTADYLLTGKLICGQCNSFMVGRSGTSRHGARYYYYACQSKAGEKCKKKPVRREWIEDEVIHVIRDYVLTDEVIEWMVDCCMEYQENTFEHQQVVALQSSVTEADRAIKNLVTAIEQGIFTLSTKARLEELEAVHKRNSEELEKMKRLQVLFPREHYKSFFERFKNGSFDDQSFRKHMIQQFISSVTLFDDHMLIAFHHSKHRGSILFRLDSVHSATAPLHQNEKTRIIPGLFAMDFSLQRERNSSIKNHPLVRVE